MPKSFFLLQYPLAPGALFYLTQVESGVPEGKHWSWLFRSEIKGQNKALGKSAYIG